MKAAFSKAEFESEIASRFGITFKPREKSPAEVILTGIGEVDTLTGGLPRGAITEIFGLASSGRTTLILSALAGATSHEEVCALVDTTDTFHPASAAIAGACLDQVLWMRCGSNLEHSFKATDLLLQGGGFGLVLLDLGNVPSRDARRIISSWWYRFRRVVENTPTAFVVIAQDSCVRSCASLTLEMKRSAEVWSATTSPSSIFDSLQETRQRANCSKESTPGKFGKYPAPVAPVPSAIQPPLSPLQPTHTRLLTGLQLGLERQKPVNVAAPAIKFVANTLQ